MSTTQLQLENGIDHEHDHCPNGNAFCPVENPSVDDAELECFDCFPEAGK